MLTIRDVDHQWKLVYEFIFLPVWCKPAKPVDHASAYAPADPGIAVNNPYDVPFCFSVSATHVTDLRVGPESVGVTIFPVEARILFLNQYPRVEAWKIMD